MVLILRKPSQKSQILTDRLEKQKGRTLFVGGALGVEPVKVAGGGGWAAELRYVAVGIG